jgi:hypothetical protein
MVLLLFADLFLVYRDYNPAVDKQWLSHPLPPALAKIRHPGEVYRATGLNLQLPPHTGGLAGLSDISGYGTPLHKRAHEFLIALFGGIQTERGMRSLLAIANERELTLLKWLNVRYILAGKNAESSVSFPGLRKIHESPATAVFENPGVFPRAYFVSGYEKLTAGEILTKLRDSPEELKTKVYFEEDVPEPPRSAPPSGDNNPDSSSARIVTYNEDRVHIEIMAAAPGFLVLTDLNYPGWEALVDGREQPIYRANYLFRAVSLDRGKHRVEFRYRPRSVKWGALASLATLAGIMATVFWRNQGRNVKPPIPE